MGNRITKATPAGCLVGLLGLVLSGGGGIMAWGCYLAQGKVDVEPGAELVWGFGLGALVSGGLGVLLLVVGFKMALRSNMSEPDDQEKPMVRF